MNGAIIIKDMPDLKFDVTSDLDVLSVKFSKEETLAGTDLIIWIDHQSETPFEITISGK